MSKPTIAEFYKGKGIVITGSTGFLGKALMEKILRECPDVGKLYLLVRPAKDQTPAQRVSSIFQEEFFDILRRTNPTFDEKARAVGADLAKPFLGIQDQEALEEMKKNASIVLHCAATVNFNERLDISLATNVVSVKNLILFARSLGHLDAFVHVSTAYAHCDRDLIEEKFYDPIVDPMSLVNVTNSMSTEFIEAITKPLLGKRPNTYTLTKSLAEAVAYSEGKDLPLAVVRPSIVGCTLRSPVPGWTDNLNGPGGLYLAAAHKVLRVMPGDEKCVIDIVPVDYCVNMIVAVSWKLGVMKPEKPMVFNCSSGALNPIVFKQHNMFLFKGINASPISSGSKVYVPIVSPENYERFWGPLVHTLPALAVDSFRQAIGKKPIMQKIYRRLKGSLQAYSFFSSHQWKWNVDNSKELMKELNQEDQINFRLDLDDLNWETYIPSIYEGSKRLLKVSKPTKGGMSGSDDAGAAAARIPVSPSSTNLASSPSSEGLVASPSTISLLGTPSSANLAEKSLPRKQGLPPVVLIAAFFIILFAVFYAFTKDVISIDA